MITALHFSLFHILIFWMLYEVWQTEKVRQEMTKTYELSNERTIMADVDEKHHTATVSIYVLDDLVKKANKADAIDKIRDEIKALPKELPTDARNMVRRTRVLDIIDKYSSIGYEGCICNTSEGCQKEDIEETIPVENMPCDNIAKKIKQ